jgi:signal transduction histidine kinase
MELSKLIDNSCQIMSPLFKKEQIELINTIAFERRLHIDPKQMEQVFINLLTNCIYALSNSEKKQIIISAEVKEKRIFITITDTGKGIEKEIENKIFLPFFTTRKEGAGIGLTLSKSIVEAHGGYLTFRNMEKKTTFVISLLDDN